MENAWDTTVPTGSMEPTIPRDTQVTIARLNETDRATVSRGDIVVFRRPDVDEPERLYISRVVATGGDTVELRDTVLYLNGVPVAEDFVKWEELFFTDSQGQRVLNNSTHEEVSLPQDTVFVMGDNRANSKDSRLYGPVPMSSIVGRVIRIR